MKLADIVTLKEAEETASKKLELSDVAKYFSGDRQRRAVEAVWGTNRLTWHGEPFFSDTGDLTRLYDEMIAKTTEHARDLEDEDSISVEHLDGAEFVFDAPISDVQEVYVGYSPEEDALYMGLDAWIDEEDFNQKWDNFFEEETGESFDNDNPEHDKIFSEAWKTFRDQHMMAGLLYRLDGEPGSLRPELVSREPGGFYQGIHTPGQTRQLIDIRLD